MYPWQVGNPFGNELERLRREMDDLTRVFITRYKPWVSSPWRETRLLPLINVTETTDAYVVSSKIPGMRTDDLSIALEGDTLCLKGERTPDDVHDDAGFHRRERATGTFHRSITLPETVDEDTVHATYRNGVLTVTLPKKKKSAPVQINVMPT